VTRTTLSDGRTIQWSERGSSGGDPVVFFHGCPDTRRASWSAHLAAFDAGIHLVAPNRPGYGASTPAPPSYRRVVADTLELADTLGFDRFGVIGMSVGGTFGLACAALAPDRVTRAALVATPGEAPRMDPPYPRDGLDAAGRRFFHSLASGPPEDNVERVRPEFLAWRAGVAPDDPDDPALAARWLGSLPDEHAVLGGQRLQPARSQRRVVTVVRRHARPPGEELRPDPLDVVLE